MHRRVQGVLALGAVVSGLTMAGCGSSTSGAHGGATAATTASTSSTPGTSSISSPAPGTSPPDTATSPGTGTGTGTGTGDTAGTADSCAGLDVQFVQLHGAAAGTTFSDLVVVNRGKTACTLPGQPKIEYLAASHKTIPVRFSADPSLPAHKLAPGASAAMAVGYSTDGNPPCDDKIAYVRVTPPGTMLTVDGPTHCAHDGFHEEAWVTGSYAAPH